MLDVPSFGRGGVDPAAPEYQLFRSIKRTIPLSGVELFANKVPYTAEQFDESASDLQTLLEILERFQK